MYKKEVGQGSLTFYFPFLVFVYDLKILPKQGCGRDRVLQTLHVLVLVEGTVILATSKQNLAKKLTMLHDYSTQQHGMSINETKTFLCCE